MELIKKRYLEILEENRLKQKDIAIKLGVNQGSISQTFGKGKITKVEYYIALQDLTNCNLNWVISGIGDKYLSMGAMPSLYKAAEDTEPYGEKQNLMAAYNKMAKKYDEMAIENSEIKEQLKLILGQLKKL